MVLDPTDVTSAGLLATLPRERRQLCGKPMALASVGQRRGADIHCPDLAALKLPIGIVPRHPLEALGGRHTSAAGAQGNRGVTHGLRLCGLITGSPSCKPRRSGPSVRPMALSSPMNTTTASRPLSTACYSSTQPTSSPTPRPAPVHRVLTRHLLTTAGLKADESRGGSWALKIIAAILGRPAVEKILSNLGLHPQPPPRGRAGEAGHDGLPA